MMNHRISPKFSAEVRERAVRMVLEQALHERKPVCGGGLIHHSDRGVQYVLIKYTERLAEAGFAPSVGSVGDRYELLDPAASTLGGKYSQAAVLLRRALIEFRLQARRPTCLGRSIAWLGRSKNYAGFETHDQFMARLLRALPRKTENF